MNNNNLDISEINKINNVNTPLINENITLSPPSTNNNNDYLNNNLYKDYTKTINELKLKRKKVFGNKIKIIDWGSRGLIGSKENEVDIISYLNKKKKIDRDELCMKLILRLLRMLFLILNLLAFLAFSGMSLNFYLFLFLHLPMLEMIHN